MLLNTIVNSMYFMLQLVQKVECCYPKPQVMSVLCHNIIDVLLLFCSVLFFSFSCSVCVYTSCLLCSMECIF